MPKEEEDDIINDYNEKKWSYLVVLDWTVSAVDCLYVSHDDN